jgi:hypothetical protein
MKLMPTLFSCFLLLIPVPVLAGSEEADTVDYLRDFLSPAKKFLTEELGSMKDLLLEMLNAPSGRETPKVIIDLPPAVMKAPALDIRVPEQAEEIPPADKQTINIEEDAQPEPILQQPSPEIIKPQTKRAPQPAPDDVLVVALPQEPERTIKIFQPGNPKPAPPVARAEILKDVKPARITEPVAAPYPVAEVAAMGQNIPVRGSGLMMGQAITLGLAFDGEIKKCIEKQNGYVLFCARDITWPEPIRKFFGSRVNLYRGSQAVVRYDGNQLTHAHALFFTSGLKDVVAYFNKRFGPPLETLQRIVTPFAGRPKNNPTYIWRKNETVNGEPLAITLEVRGFDDSRGGFPDLEHGLVRLYGANSLPIFPRVSTMEMMLVRHALN